jgi:phosphoglycerol transferase MdoB-like AlkP superfamily enzyme
MLNGTSVSGRRGVFTYQVASLWHTERLSSDIDVDPGLPASVIATIAELKGPTPGERAHPEVAHGAAAGANLIVIQCEALQTFLVDAEAGGREVTPNLNALVRESWYFPRTFAQIAGGNTADAEWVSNTSLYPPTSEPASVRWQDRAVPSLPRVLRASGYLAETFHTNDASFWNRRNLYAALGFDRYYDRDFFGTDDEITFGSPSDEYLFARTLDVLEGHAQRGQRFYAQIITMSAHHPFRPLPARKRPVDFGEPYSGTVVGRYLSNQEYADRALGQFIEGLKTSGLWENSVVIVYGDHFGLGELDPQGDDKVAIETLLGRPYTMLDRLNVPLVIHLPGQTEGDLSSDTAAQKDIAPTILDLLGIDPRALPLFGRSLFAGGPVIAGLQRSAPVGSYASESALVMPDGEKGAVAVPLDDPFSRRPATPEEAARLKAASELMVLSAEYCDALPVRPDFVPDAKMDIPK